MDRGLQEHEAGDREKIMMQEIERLQSENSDLRELREFDRDRMQNEMHELRYRMDSIGLQNMSRSGINPMYIKKEQEDPFEAEVPKTSTSLTNQQKQDDGFGLFTDQTPLEEKKQSAGHSTKVKAATYDGSSSWRDYKAHFQTCAEINNWSYLEKGLYLAVSLRGQAQGVMGNLCTNTKDYNALVNTLEERFAPPNQADLYRAQLRERRQKASESLSE